MLNTSVSTLQPRKLKKKVAKKELGNYKRRVTRNTFLFVLLIFHCSFFFMHPFTLKFNYLYTYLLTYTSCYFKIQLPNTPNFLPVLAHWENEAEVIGQQKTMLSWPHNVSSESGHAPPPAAPNRPLRGGIVLIEFQ